MQLSRGTINAQRLFGVRELALRNPEPHVEFVIRAFVEIGEAVAARWIQMPRGILLLLVVPENPASGAIYLYDRDAQDFYMICFDGPDDDLTPDQFRDLFSEYNLIQYAEDPSRLHQSRQMPSA